VKRCMAGAELGEGDMALTMQRKAAIGD
jgi:hypothetical protein